MVQASRCGDLRLIHEFSVGSSSSSAPRVVYEASYLPFLHSGHEEDSEDETQHSMSTYRPGRWNNLPPEQVKVRQA